MVREKTENKKLNCVISKTFTQFTNISLKKMRKREKKY